MRKLLLAVLLIGAPAVAAADEIHWERAINLYVGESLVIAPARATCDEHKIPKWAWIERNLPASKLGGFSDGGVGRTNSPGCGGVVPARAIVFTAEKPGEERFEIYGAQFSVSVR